MIHPPTKFHTFYRNDSKQYIENQRITDNNRYVAKTYINQGLSRSEALAYIESLKVQDHLRQRMTTQKTHKLWIHPHTKWAETI